MLFSFIIDNFYKFEIVDDQEKTEEEENRLTGDNKQPIRRRILGYSKSPEYQKQSIFNKTNLNNHIFEI